MTPAHPTTVALDVGPLHGHRTGVGTAVAHLVEALGRRHDVALVPYLVSARARVTPPERRLPLPAAVAMRAWSRAGWPRVDRWLGAADVVHGTNYAVPPSRLPSLVSVYDCWALRHPEQAGAAVRRSGEVLRRAVRAGAHVHVSSHATARAAGELLGTEHVHVVHLGPLPTPAPGSPPRADLLGATFVLALGTVERRKALPSLVAAFGRIAGAHPGVRLVLAGAPGDASREVAEAVAQLGAPADRVVVLGPVDAGAKGWLLAHAAALAYPSWDEGFGFPVLEAQTAGLPVVARRSGSIPEVGGDGVLLVDDDDGEEAFVTSFASALEQVLDDGAVRLGLIAAGHTNVARFDWDDTAAGLASLYHALAATGAAVGR